MAKTRLILDIVATDRTFSRVDYRGREVWAGKCIHCNGHLYVSLSGRPINRATVEHIQPKNHGGTNDLENVALACSRCNNQKGVHLDARRADDPRLRKVVEKLLEKRKKRWRDERR